MVLIDRSVQSFFVKVVVYGECVHLKNAMPFVLYGAGSRIVVCYIVIIVFLVINHIRILNKKTNHTFE